MHILRLSSRYSANRVGAPGGATDIGRVKTKA